jgi:ribosomal protein S18 acetylase RimI-like enzyme
MSASAKPRLAGRQPSVRGRGAPEETRLGALVAEQAAKPEVPLSTIPSADRNSAAEQLGTPGGLRRLRLARTADAERIALLHADSWRRYYRGAYADSFLDGDVAADRRSVWSARLAAPADSRTVVADDDGRLVGFVHVVFDQDPVWGSLVDNLHVVHDHHRGGIGTALLADAARAVVNHAAADGMYLWVLEQNAAAQHFYRACGARHVETATVSPPGGDPSRLHGTPRKFRMAWTDATEPGELGQVAMRTISYRTRPSPGS